MKPQWKRKPQRSAEHLAFIRQLRCVICGGGFPCEAAHIRIRTDGGMGMKPSDEFTVPLCSRHHAEQHRGELTFWARYRINPHELASRLYAASGDHEAGELIVFQARRTCVAEAPRA